MAENNTFISGIGNGVLSAALSDLPPWATEDTLSRIHGVLVKTLKVNTDISDELARAAKTVGNKGNSDDVKRLHQAYKKLSDQAKKDYDDKGYRSNMEKRWFDRGEATRKLLTSSNFRLAVAANMVESAFSKMKETMINNANTFDGLYKSGINVMESSDFTTSGFDSLRTMVARVGLDLSQLSKIISESVGINVVGAQTFTKALSMSSGKLREFGYNTAESGELIGAYLDSLSAMGAAQGKSKDMIADGAIMFGESMTKLSFRTGTAIKQLQAQTAAIAASTDANVIAAEKGAAAGLMASQFAASFRDPNLGKEFLKMMASKIPTLNKTFQNLVAGGLGGFGQKLMAFNKSLVGLTPEAAAVAKKRFYGSISNIDQMIQEQQYLADAGVQGSAENVQILTAIKQDNEKLKVISDDQLKREMKTAESVKGVQSEWASLMATASKLFAPITWILDVITGGLKMVNAVVGGLLDIPILGTVISVAATATVTFTAALLTSRMAMYSLAGIFPIIRTAVMGIMPAIAKFLAFLVASPAKLLALVPVIMAKAGAVIMGAAGLLAGAIGWITTALTTAAGVVVGGVARLVAAVALPFAPLIAVIASIVGVGALLYTYWDDIVSVSKSVWAGLSDLGGVAVSIGNQVRNGLGAVWDSVSGIFTIATDLVTGVVGAWLTAGTYIKKGAEVVWEFISSPFKSLSNAFSGLGNIAGSIGDKLKTGVSAVWDIITRPFVSLWEWIKGSWAGKILSLGNADNSSSQSKSASVGSVLSAPAITIQSPTHTDIVMPKGPSVVRAKQSDGKSSDIQVGAAPSPDNRPSTPATGDSNRQAAVVRDIDRFAEINNTLSYQAAQLDQLVEGIKSLLSVNRDILKYTKIQ